VYNFEVFRITYRITFLCFIKRHGRVSALKCARPNRVSIRELASRSFQNQNRTIILSFKKTVIYIYIYTFYKKKKY